MLLSSPLILYVLSSSDEVCSLSGCCWVESARRGSDSTMMLCVNEGNVGETYSKSSSLSDMDASFSKQKEYSPTCRQLRSLPYRTRLIRREDVVSLTLIVPFEKHLVVRIHDDIVHVERAA